MCGEVQRTDRGGKNSKVVFSVGLKNCYNDISQKVKDAIDKGRIGKGLLADCFTGSFELRNI